MSILAIGTVAFDSIETPVDKVDRTLGGSALYITLAARYFSDSVRLVSVVGHDFPPEAIALMETRGVDVDGLEIDPDGETFFWAGRYHENFNNRDTLATHLNVLATFDPKVPGAYKDSKIICLGNLDPVVQMRVLDQIPAPELVVCDTMNYWIDHTPTALREVLQRIDVLIINDEEARQMAGQRHLLDCAHTIRAMGPQTLVIKKGEHGALLFFEDQLFHVPALLLPTITDPTGAGDTFAGGFVGYLAQAHDYSFDNLKKAVVYGSAMASFCVEHFGADGLLNLTPAAIAARIQAFRTLTEIPA